jgi:hypothetical protein
LLITGWRLLIPRRWLLAVAAGGLWITATALARDEREAAQGEACGDGQSKHAFLLDAGEPGGS